MKKVYKKGKIMQQTKLIGVCLSTIHEEDRYNFVIELNKHAVRNGYKLIVFNSCADLYEENNATNKGSSAVFKLIPYESLSALVILPNIMYDDGIVDDVVKNCRKYKIPIISVDKKIDGCTMVSFTDSDVFEKLCRHVVEYHGAKNIFFVAGFKDNVYSEERVKAFKKVLADNGIPFNEDNIGYGCFWETPTIELLDKWFVTEKRKIPDAIICANDFMAITVSGYLQEMGVNIPKDCIVTGFDGIRQIEYLPPTITTCKHDFDKMGQLITELITRMLNGEIVDNEYKVDFSIVYSQSCGCEKIDQHSSRHCIQALIKSLRYSDERQKMICSTHASVPKIADINFLPRILMNRFKFDTCVFALNEGIFDPPDFGNRYKDDTPFSDNVNILYHRYNKVEYEQCNIPLKKLLPRYDLLLNSERPIVVCCSNFTEQVMGYCVFQPTINIDEYEKMQNIMSTIGAALGSFHSRMQIKSINHELQKLSQRDFMTGLFNRRGFFEKLERRISDDNSIGSSLIIISADLDELKYINDNFGHAEGDNAIITVGRALFASSLQNEICARFGGDEFCTAVLIRNCPEEDFYEEFKRRFFEYLCDYNAKSNKPYSVRASIGYFSAPVSGDIDIDEIIRLADKKMYTFKQARKRKKNNPQI